MHAYIDDAKDGDAYPYFRILDINVLQLFPWVWYKYFFRSLIEEVIVNSYDEFHHLSDE